jgi:hypothetical protein
MRRRGALRWIAGGMLWASLMIAHPAHSQIADGKADLVLLYGVQFVDSRISIDVVSSGCTDETYFTAKVEPLPDSLQLSIIQLKPDRCRMSPHIVSVTLDIPSIAAPNEARVQLLNKLAIPDARLRPAR